MIDTKVRNRHLAAAHGLTAWVLGHDVYQPRVILYDSGDEQFKSFWQPSFAEPMDEVIDIVDVAGTTAKCKLIEPNYARGFVDGATGLSERLREDRLT